MSERFIDNGDGTVTDTKTGLMWQKDTPLVSYNWDDALKYCEALTLAGHSDWRLPTCKELQSIVDYERCNPAIDPMFECHLSCYWSASTLVGYPDYAWYVIFGFGGVSFVNKIGGFSVRAVRG